MGRYRFAWRRFAPGTPGGTGAVHPGPFPVAIADLAPTDPLGTTGARQILQGAQNGLAIHVCVEQADYHEGLWWGHWNEWIKQYAGPRVPAHEPGAGVLPQIEPAPGSYVRG